MDWQRNQTKIDLQFEPEMETNPGTEAEMVPETETEIEPDVELG